MGKGDKNMKYTFKVEQARNGKIAIYGRSQTVMLTLSQISGLDIDVSKLDDFDLESYQKAYHLEDAAYTGIPVCSPKRADLFRTLLEEYKAQPQTPMREATVCLLKEMSEELPKDWLSYENRPPQKFIGRISTTYGNADKITFETSGGEHLWEVGYTPQLREFIMHGWDIGRHRRYDYDIDTDLVASVKGTQLVGLEWLVPWDADKRWVWRLESADNLRCSCAVHKEERIYIFVQAIPCIDESGERKYRYSEAFVSLKRYAPDMIVDLLQKHGHCLAEFHIAGGSYIDWWQIADIIAQSELKEPRNMYKALLTFDEVRKKIEEETELDLSACRPAFRLQEEV